MKRRRMRLLAVAARAIDDSATTSARNRGSNVAGKRTSRSFGTDHWLVVIVLALSLSSVQCEGKTCATVACDRGQVNMINSANTDCGTRCTKHFCCIESFAVVRPFFGGDASELAESVIRWEAFPPCELDAHAIPVRKDLPVDLTLYFARDVTLPEHAAMRSIIEPIITTNSTYETSSWRQCFKSITLLGVSIIGTDRDVFGYIPYRTIDKAAVQ